MASLEVAASHVPAVLFDELARQLEATGQLTAPPYQLALADAAVLACEVRGFARVAAACARSCEGAEGLARDLRQVRE